MIKDAGITTTGAASQGNQLPLLQKEYETYRKEEQLWKVYNNIVSYSIKSDGKIYRISDGREVELPW